MARANRCLIPAFSASSRCAVEPLESRRLFAAVLLSQIPDQNGNAGGSTAVDLDSHFDDNTTTFVQVTTPVGSFRIQLLDQQKPITVQNFLSYVNNVGGNTYDGTFIHRSDTLNGAPTAPEIIQGGGYVFPGFAHVTTSAPIQNEFSTNGIVSNTRGTIAMAKTSDPNSATSEWFVNAIDNSTALDDTSNSGGFTVFGRVVDADLPVIDAIAAVPRFQFSAPFTAIPLRNFSKSDVGKKTPGANNLVTTDVAQIPDVATSVFTITATSSDPSLVNPVISNGQLLLNYGNGTGSAQITVTATPIGGGSPVQSVFTSNVAPFQVILGGDSGNRSVTYTDADGSKNTISLKGSGAASILFTGTDLGQIAAKGKIAVVGTGDVLSVNLTGTDASTSFSISSKGGGGSASVGTIAADGAVKSITGKNTVLTDSLTTGGAAGSITLGAETSATLTIGGSPSDKGVALSLGSMSDTSVSSGSPIRSLKLSSAVNTDSTIDSLIAPQIGSVSSSGDFGEDIVMADGQNLGSLKVGGNLTGNITAHQIGSLSVKGGVSGVTITALHSAAEAADAAEANSKANKAIQSIKVGGAVTNTTVNSGGSIGSLAAGSLTGSFVVLGNPTLTGLATTLADLTAPATLGALKVKGLFANSDVTGRFIGKASLGSVQTDNGGTPFGFAADTIAALSGKTTDGRKFSFKKLDTQSDFTAQLGGASLGDVVVVLL